MPKFEATFTCSITGESGSGFPTARLITFGPDVQDRPSLRRFVEIRLTTNDYELMKTLDEHGYFLVTLTPAPE